MSKLTLQIKTSECGNIITAHDSTLNDTWYYKDLNFEGGKIYGLVSEHGQGCEFLSYLLGGKVTFDGVKMMLNDSPATPSDFKGISWNLEPLKEKYQNAVVRKSIEKALKEFGNGITFEMISERFMLTPERNDRKYKQLSGERWRAAAAYGYALGRRIFFAPYETSGFYCSMCGSSLLKALRELTNEGALVALPVGSDTFIKHIADEVIYLDKEYDIDSLKAFYSERWSDSWIK